MDLDPYSEYRYNFLFFLLVLTVFWTFFLHGSRFSGSDPDFWPIRILT